MATVRFDPAASVIRKLGGEKIVSEITGTAYTAPYRWQYAVDNRGTGGKVPAKHIPALLRYAADMGIELSASDFFTEVRVADEEGALQ